MRRFAPDAGVAQRLKGVTVCTVGSEPWRGSLSDRILIAENRCAALFVSTVSPDRNQDRRCSVCVGQTVQVGHGETRERGKGFWQSGAGGETVTPLRPPPRGTCVSRVQPDSASPSAQEFQLLLNGLAAAELRRMFCSDEGARRLTADGCCEFSMCAARDGGLSKMGVGRRSPAAWSAREIELQVRSQRRKAREIKELTELGPSP